MKPLLRRVLASAALVALVCCSLGVARQSIAEDLLTIGSDAPPLDVEHWVQNGGGKLGKVTNFAPGKVYVVEFWATWCGPCIISMPQLVELQKKYVDQGVQLISISDESLETVEEFLKREVPPRLVGESKDPISFRELTKSYCLTTDPDGSSNEQYMIASRQSTIPCAFIVGKDGKIEWIGSPLELEEPLSMVVSDTWDREKFATAMKEAREQEALMNSAKKEIGTLTKKREYAAALAKIDEYVEKTKSAEAKLSLLDVKLQLHQLAKSKLDDVKATYEKMFEVAQVDPFLAYQTAMNVFELNEQGKIDSKQILRGARDLAKNVAAQQEGNTKALLLESFARLEYALGNNEGALKIQEEAMSVADAKGKEQLQEFLDELKARVSKEKR